MSYWVGNYASSIRMEVEEVEVKKIVEGDIEIIEREMGEAEEGILVEGEGIMRVVEKSKQLDVIIVEKKDILLENAKVSYY